MRNKPWWRSRTLWVNFGAVAASFLAMPELGRVLPTEATPYLALAVSGLGLLNMWLRTGTTQGLNNGRSLPSPPTAVDAQVKRE